MPIDPDVIRSRIAARFRSHAAAARAAEISPQRLSEILRGIRIEHIELSMVERLARMLDVPVSQILR